MVGYFGPLVPEVRRRAAKLHIFERVDLPQGDLLPQERAGEILPHCQVAIISATTLLNRTLEPLLSKPAPPAARWSCWAPAPRCARRYSPAPR